MFKKVAKTLVSVFAHSVIATSGAIIAYVGVNIVGNAFKSYSEEFDKTWGTNNNKIDTSNMKSAGEDKKEENV